MPMTTTPIKCPDAAVLDSQVFTENGKALRQGVRASRADGEDNAPAAKDALDCPRAQRESRLGAAKAGISPSGAAGELT